MRDRKLVALVLLVLALSLGHSGEHLAREAIRAPAVIVMFLIYGFIALGLALYAKGKVGPLFWAIAAGIGFVFGLLAHGSPFTEQTPRFIVAAYASVLAAALAVSVLVALMASLVATSVYATWLATRLPSPRH